MAFIANGSSGNYLQPPTIGGGVRPLVGSETWTIFCWVYPTSTTGYQNVFYLNASNAFQTDGSNWNYWYSASNGDNFSTFSANNWYWLAFAKNGTTELRYFANGTYLSNRTTGLNQVIPEAQVAYIGSWEGSSDWPSHAYGPMIIYDAFLTDAEIIAQYGRICPIRTANLRAFYPFWNGGATERVRDYSGNGRDLTQTGTAYADATVSGPPVPFTAGIWQIPFTAPVAESERAIKILKPRRTIQIPVHQLQL